jgi:hypothetical protein
MQGHLLRCYWYRSGAPYYAECIDLDLIARGDSGEEAIGKLQEAVYGYLAVAFRGDSTKGLVPRRSPLSQRLHYHAQRLLCRLRDRTPHVFPLHLAPGVPPR